MKFICTQENLNQGLLAVSHIAGKNASLPILNNILIKVEDGVMKLTSTDLELGVNCIVRGKAEEEGEITIEAKLLTNYIGLLPKEKVELSKENETLFIKTENSESKINGTAVAEFPLIPQVEKTKGLSIPLIDFKEALKQIAFSITSNDLRPEIGGALFKFEASQLILAGTDSYRLAEKKLKIDNPEEVKRDLIVPLKTLQELIRILNTLETAKKVDIYLTENQVLFSLENIDLVSRLIEGQYPDYQQIIPNNFKTQVEAERDGLLKAVKTASLFAKSGTFEIDLELLPEKKEIVILAENSQLGRNQSKIKADIKGGKSKLTINYHYLIDALNNLEKEEVLLEVTDNSIPCILRPKGEEQYLCLIMPITKE